MFTVGIVMHILIFITILLASLSFFSHFYFFIFFWSVIELDITFIILLEIIILLSNNKKNYKKLEAVPMKSCIVNLKKTAICVIHINLSFYISELIEKSNIGINTTSFLQPNSPNWKTVFIFFSLLPLYFQISQLKDYARYYFHNFPFI